MYAVIQTGGKQYKVAPGEIVQVEKLDGEIGSAKTFSEVLLVAKPGADSTTIWLGKPTLNGAAVAAEIVGQGRGDDAWHDGEVAHAQQGAVPRPAVNARGAN